MPCTKLGSHTICLEYVLVLVVVFIFLYGYIVRAYLKRDLLEQSIVPISGMDGWGLLHFLLFFILGFLYPDRFVLLTLFGCGWEGIETVLGQYKIMMFGRRVQLIGNTDAHGTVLEQEEEAWWYGRISDVALDTVGIVLGVYARHQYDGASPFACPAQP